MSITEDYWERHEREHKPFWVVGSNIHDGTSEVYGPFRGPPHMTYEFMREDGCDQFGDHIFQWMDPQDIGEGNPHGYESWTGAENDERYFGWRAMKPRKNTIGEPTGPFWTDLNISSEDPT